MENRISEFMKLKGVTNVALAEHLGISKVAVSNIVTGKSIPSMDKAIAIAKILGVSVEALAGEEHQNEQTNKTFNIVCPKCGEKITLKVED